jgi:Condensation domain
VPTDAPLTYGQLSTWRSMETFAADRLMEVNVPASWDLRGMETPAVLRALRRLTERHESLRTTYHLSGGQPVQRVHEDAEPRVEVVEREAVEAQDVVRATWELHDRPFPVTGDVGWRALLTTSGGRPRFLALSLSHMVVDLWAVQELETEFRALVADPDRDDGPAPAPRDLALLQRGEAFAARRRGAEAYWRRLLTNGPVRNLPAPPPRPAERRIQATLRSHLLRELAEQASKAHGVSPQSLLMAVTAAALARAVGRDRVMLSVMSANRFDPRWQPLISTMNQLVPVVCDVDPQSSLVKHLKRAHLGALLAYRHSSYDVDMADGLAREIPAPDGAAFDHDCWFNYLTGIKRDALAPDGPADAADLAWTEPARHAGHPFYVRVNAHETTEITLRADPDLVPAEEVVRVLRTTALGVLRAATDPETTLGALADSTAPHDLPPALFPREFPPGP